MRRTVTAALIALALVVLSPSAQLSAKATLVKRIGNNTEGATLVSNGAGQAQIALIDGYDVLVVPVGGNGKAPAHKIFDVKSHQWTAFPSGIAFLGVEKNFQPARKAHVGFLVDDIRTIIAECGRRGLENVDDGPLDATLRSGISRSPHRLCQRRHPWAGSLDAGSGSCL